MIANLTSATAKRLKPLTSSLQRWKFTASALQQKSIDSLPGNYETTQEEQIRLFTEAYNLFEEKYQIAKEYDAESPMIKMNAMHNPVVTLFSHDLVKQLQEYELRGKTKRKFSSNIHKLSGRFSYEYGQTHSKQRAKAAKSFKPHMIEQYTPFIQSSAQSTLLEAIANESQSRNDSIYFCDVAKKFAYDIGIKFVYGPLLSDEERNELFPVISFIMSLICCL